MPVNFVSRRSGSVLIIVLWAVSFLSIVTLALSSRATSLLRLHSRVMEQLQSSAALNAAYQYAVWLMEQDETSAFDGFTESWKGKGVLPLRALEAKTVSSRLELNVRWQLEGENHKLPLNTAPAKVLRQLFFDVSGADWSQSGIIADSIVDWRDEDNEALPNGAEDFYYMGLRPSYESQDAPFRNVEELRFVRGMTEAIYVRISPYVTAHSDGRLNINTADREILNALGLSVTGEEGLMSFLVGEDGVRGNNDDRLFVSPQSILGELEGYLPAQDLQTLMALQKTQILGVRDSHIRLVAEIQNLHEYGRVRLEAVIDREGKKLFWREY